MRMQIVRAEPDDWERLRDLRLRALLDAPDAFGSTHDDEAARTEEEWRAFAAGWEGAARQAAFVAVDEDGRWIGLAVGVVHEADTSLANLYAMWVDPAARGLGAGRLLVETVATWAAGTGAERLELCVTEANDPAVSLYATAGFEPTGGRDVLRPGSDVATVTLRRPLDVPPDLVDGLMAEQVRYYEDRAPVYDELWHRQGRYDRGPEFNERWFRETAALEAAVPDTAGLRVLELAPGTGIWTRRFAPGAARLLAVDASPAMLARNREAVADPRVEYVQADLFEWGPPGGETFDLIAFGFFLSHVPPDRFDIFWTRLRDWLAPGGRVWFCDDVAGPGRPYSGATVVGVPIANTRSFDTDDEYRIVKIFWHPRDLASRLAELGWDAEVRSTGEHFLVGEATPAPTPG
jgi:demethylmenaquinone methyltransferase/2-methoxy-6-polyprenyl-1,4-benzoquinol methylase